MPSKQYKVSVEREIIYVRVSRNHPRFQEAEFIAFKIYGQNEQRFGCRKMWIKLRKDRLHVREYS